MQKLSTQKIIIGLIATTFAGVSLYLITSKKTIPPKPIVQQAVIQKPKAITKPAYPETIKGEIITLKLISPKYTFDYYKKFSPTVRKFYEFPEKITFSYVEHLVNLEMEKLKAGEAIIYIIWDNEKDEFAGSIQIKNDTTEVLGQLSMWLNENFWGGGRIQEAMYLISKAFFDGNPSINEYNAHVRHWNHRSYRALEKFGFKLIKDDHTDEEYGLRRIYKLYRKVIEKQTKERAVKA